jgi:hypothetical protein
MTLAKLLIAMLSAASLPSEWLLFLRTMLTSGLSDAEFLALHALRLAGIVTPLLFGVQWVLQALDKDDRGSQQQNYIFRGAKR